MDNPRTFCPRCGAARTGPFCATCGTQLDPEPIAPIAATPPKATGSKGRPIAIGIFLVMVAALAVAAMTTKPGSPPGSTQIIPPSGSIWFGTSFDPATFELRGHETAVGLNEAFSFVAHTTRSIRGSDMVIRVYLDNALIGTTSANAQGEGDLWGFTPGPFFSAGTWRYELADIGGNVIAVGDVVAR